MKNVANIMICVSLLAIVSGSYAQRYEIGLMGGISYYVGDLNPTGHFKQVHPAASVYFRQNLTAHWSIRGGFMYARVSGADSLGVSDYQTFRNLSFRSDIYELHFMVELNFFPYVPGQLDRYNWTPYLFVGVAAFYMAPKARYNGTLVDLQSLGTEGQYTANNRKNPYFPVQPAFPFGLGIKVNVGKRITLGLEYSMRLLFTDYLDDVSTVYVDENELISVSGQVAADMSENFESPYDGPVPLTNYQRGISNDKDWYSFLALSLTFNIPDPKICPSYQLGPVRNNRYY